jgi:putative ABC transport system permease protein
MRTVVQDVLFTLKQLSKQKAFAAAALLTLALCIGANTAIFSVLNSVLLKPLPFEGSDRLVHIYNSYPGAGSERGGAAVPDYYDRREAVDALESVAMFQNRGMTIGESGRPERVSGQAVTPSFFGMLGVDAVAGRTFLPEEGEPGNERHAVLSWGLWQEQYGGTADAIGGTIRINDDAHTIVGVMPRGFVFQERDARLWVPLAFTEEQRSDNARHSNSWSMIAKLRPGFSIGQAQQQIDALNARLDERLPQLRELLAGIGFRTVVVDYRSDHTRDVQGTLWLLQAGVLFVLLIGCINIANLVLVRSTSRHRELATRAALGAGRGRLARQMLTESLVLALLGGVFGLLLGWGAVKAFSAFAMDALPRSAEIVMDGTTMLVALAVALLAGLLFGAMPVARLLGADLSAIFREEGRSGTASGGTNRWRGALVVAQVSLACTLLVGAGLMMTSFARTLDVHPGFDTDGILVASLALPVTRYPDADARRDFSQRLLDAVVGLPGVERAALTNILPMGDQMNASAVTPEGYEPRPDDPLFAPVISSVSDDYFEAMGVGVVTGRTFQTGDGGGALPVAVVDRYLAERYWPGENAIGRRLALGVVEMGEELEYRTVIGVVENVRMTSLAGDDQHGHFYFPVADAPASGTYLVVKSGLPPQALTNVLRATVVGLDADLPLHDVRTMDERLADSLATERLRMLLLVAFGVLALLLAAIGLYGVLAYSVAQRRAEIGIRMALGSDAAAVFRLILRQGALLLAIGLGVGVGGSFVLGRFVQSMLYGVNATDPAVIATVIIVLAASGLAACALPARRAMHVDPMAAMRDAG